MASHRDEILAAAGRLFRARGIEGVTVAEIMQAAGLTHGGFYGHYRSKNDLVAASCGSVLTDSAQRWRQRAAAAEDPIDAIVSAYLSATVLEQPERGCPIPSLASEAARAGGAIAQAISGGIDELLTVLTELCPRPQAERGAAALSALSTMIGGVVLARACADPARARAVLEASRSTAINTLKTAL